MSCIILYLDIFTYVRVLVMLKSQIKSSSSKPLSEPLTMALLIDLANLRDDSVGRFRKKWNQLYGRLGENELLRRRDELRLLWTVPFSTIDPKNPDGLAESMHLHLTARTEAIEEASK